MRLIWMLLVLVPLSGCADTSLDLTCDELAALQPSSYPLDPIMQGTDREVAGRLADAVGDPITGPSGEDHGQYVRAWDTENGGASVSYGGGRLIYVGYFTDTTLSKEDGSEMRLDLHNIMVRAGADPHEYRFEGPHEGDFDDSLAVYAYKGAQNSWWRLQIRDAEHGVMISSLRDAIEPMPDDEVEAYGLAHGRCSLQASGQSDSVWVEDVQANMFWLGDAPGKYVTLKTPECGGYIIVEVVTGANLEGGVSAVCPDYET